MDFNIRPVRENDAIAINRIHGYYVENTVITFRFDPCTVDETLAGIRANYEANLPYIVAVDSFDHVLGYLSTGGYRSTKHGYWHTVEISLLCDPQSTGSGVGSALVERLLLILRDPIGCEEYLPDPVNLRKICQVIACMAIDTQGPRRGIALKEFYERLGFVERGRLPQVGYKFGRW